MHARRSCVLVRPLLVVGRMAKYDALLTALGYHLPRPRRRRRRPEPTDGTVRPRRRPISTETDNPLQAPSTPVDKFTNADVIQLRYKFHATQSQFARMFGISVETLRNWEQGKRKPTGPARALLRVASANPEVVARTLWRYRRAWWMD